MTKYKTYISIDEKEYFWIIVENGKVINRNATREELHKIITKPKFYNKTNICPTCRKENNVTDRSILYPRNARQDISEDGKKTNRYVCMHHYGVNYGRYVPNSRNNIIKSLRDRRTGSLKDEGNILGDNCEELTEKWLGAKRLATKYDKYSMLPLDHDPIQKHILAMIGNKLVDLYGKVPQTKGRHYSPTGGYWSASTVREYNKKFDILILYCVSEDGKTVERIYIFPREDIITISGTTIYKSPTDCAGDPIIGIYEKYRIVDQEQLKKVNNIWKDIIKR